MAGYDIFHNYGFSEESLSNSLKTKKKLTEAVDNTYYNSLIRKQDAEIQTLQTQYNTGDKSPSDIVLELGYHQDEENEHQFKKEEGSYTLVVDFFDYDNWDDPIVYYVLDPSGRIPSGYCRTKYKLQGVTDSSDWMEEGLEDTTVSGTFADKDFVNKGLDDVYGIDCDDDQSYRDRR